MAQVVLGNGRSTRHPSGRLGRRCLWEFMLSALRGEKNEKSSFGDTITRLCSEMDVFPIWGDGLGFVFHPDIWCPSVAGPPSQLGDGISHTLWAVVWWLLVPSREWEIPWEEGLYIWVMSGHFAAGGENVFASIRTCRNSVWTYFRHFWKGNSNPNQNNPSRNINSLKLT